MSNTRDILTAYSQQQATADQVWRALTEHAGWYVPAAFALDRLQAGVSEHAMIFAEQLQPNPPDLVLFSDRVAAARAEGAPLGVFVSTFSGVHIFQALDNQFQNVIVNPNSPKSEQWYINQGAYPLAKLWADVVNLEQKIGKATADTVPYAEIAAHPGFLVLINQQSLPVTLNLKDPEGSYAVAFPAPDRYHAFIAKQPAENQSNLKFATLDGVNLSKQLQRFEVAGLVLYWGETSALVLRRDELESVVQAGS